MYSPISCSNREVNQTAQTAIIEMISALTRSPHYHTQAETISKCTEMLSFLQIEERTTDDDEWENDQMGSPLIVTDQDALIILSTAIKISLTVAEDCFRNPESWENVLEFGAPLTEKDWVELREWHRDLHRIYDYLYGVMSEAKNV